MGTETLPNSATVAAGLKIQSADFLTTNAAMKGDFVGRNSAGAPSPNQNLGTTLYPWGHGIFKSVTIDGNIIDLSRIVTPTTRIISGQTRSTSGQPQFLQANGSAASVKILASSTDLVLSINSNSVTIDSDITKTGLTTAPNPVNYRCYVNVAVTRNVAQTKYYGEIGGKTPIMKIDTTLGSITSRIGQFISLKTPTNEIMFGWFKSSTDFVNVYRGFYFDSSLNPIVRETLVNNEVLTLLETGWIFLDKDGATVDVTYKTPVYGYTAPSSPATAQYWYDLANNTWKRYSGSAWIAVDRIPIGLCVMDTSNCIATRSFDFYHDFKDTNTLKCEVFSNTVVRSGYNTNKINVYGTDLNIDNYPVEWDNTADMETGSVANDTDYYLYITTKGKPVISVERPYDRSFDLRGKYHPYNNWRYVAKARTYGSAYWFNVEISAIYDSKSTVAKWAEEDLRIFRASATWVRCKFSKLVLTNKEGATKTLWGPRMLTFNTSTDMQGPELASTWYQLWIDGSGKLAMVPDLTGTTTGSSTGYLVDSGNLFSTYSVYRGAKVYNLSTAYPLTSGYQDTVTASAMSNGASLQLLSGSNVFYASGQSYVVHITNPVGLDSFATNIGAVYNDSSSNLEDFRQNGRLVSTDPKTVLSGGLSGAYAAVNISRAVPITARKISGTLRSDSASGTATGFAIANNPNGVYGTGEKWVYINVGGNGTNQLSLWTYFSLPIVYRQLIYYRVSSGTAEIIVSGYEI